MAVKKNTTKPNILLIAIDSLRRDHMSAYGYHRQTTPHLARFAQGATLFEETLCAHVPTTPAYANMLTGRDCFGTEVVALRHKGGLTPKVRTLAEILREQGYASTCVGFTGNPSSRGFDTYLDYPNAWGGYEDRPLVKAQNLNNVAQPELTRLQAGGKPWFLMLRHMDPHSPYLPPDPYVRMFYHGNETDPANKSMEPVKAQKPFRDFLLSWMPPGISDKDYVIAQYDGALAYMDACIQAIFQQLETMAILDNTIVVVNADHGETLYDHDCFFDHHGLYEPTLVVPLIIRYPSKLPAGRRVKGLNQHKNLVPTLLELAEIRVPDAFDGQPLTRLVEGQVASFESEIYLTECTWMRKHGWRTPQWKLIRALEPDFHFKPEIELYNLIEDPDENRNVAAENPDVVANLTARMNTYIALREKQTGNPNPIHTQGDWHGKEGVGPFKTSQQAYDTLYIGSATQAKKLQEKAR